MMLNSAQKIIKALLIIFLASVGFGIDSLGIDMNSGKLFVPALIIGIVIITGGIGWACWKWRSQGVKSGVTAFSLSFLVLGLIFFFWGLLTVYNFQSIAGQYLRSMSRKYRIMYWRSLSLTIGSLVTTLGGGVLFIKKESFNEMRGDIGGDISDMVEDTGIGVGKSGEACPHCGKEVKKDWVKCPSCTALLKEKCQNCGELIEKDFMACPYCGHEVVKLESGFEGENEKREREEQSPLPPEEEIFAREPVSYECTVCGKSVEEEDNNCPYCGVSFE